MSKAEPAARPPALARPRKAAYRNQFGVIVRCKDEAEHKRVFEQLRKLGLKPRLVVT